MHTYTERFPTRCFPYLWQIVIPLHTLALGWSDIFETSPERDLGGLRHDNRLNKHIFYLVSSYLVESVHLQICDNAINWNPTEKIYGTKKSCRTFSMAATPSCSCAERWTATPPSPAIRLKSFWSQKLQAFQKSISLTSTISNKTLKLLHCLGHLRVLQKIHEYRFGFVKTPSN